MRGALTAALRRASPGCPSTRATARLRIPSPHTSKVWPAHLRTYDYLFPGLTLPACPAFPAPPRPHLTRPPAAPSSRVTVSSTSGLSSCQCCLPGPGAAPCTPRRAPAGLTLRKTPAPPKAPLPPWRKGREIMPSSPTALGWRWGLDPSQAAVGTWPVAGNSFAGAERSSSLEEGVRLSTHPASEGVSPTEG